MIMSMTGYGRQSTETESFSITVELRSVNHRFAEISVYVPRPFMIYEDKVKRLLGQYISRGKVDVYISIEGEGLYNRELDVDWNLLKQYIETMEEAAERFSVSKGITAGELLKVSEAFAVVEKGSETGKVEEVLLQTANGALEQLLDMRRNEGRHLLKDFQQRLDQIEISLGKLREYAPKVAEAYRLRLLERIKGFLEGKVEIDETRLMNEVAVFSDKVNIDEELTRLQSHVRQFRKYLEDGGAIGKKLNFLQQEMNRETNTIGAKANDLDISLQVVEMKSELEKIKEQIQNIE
ncbi:MAG TPA: YicC/YloC family endoribonuclease [Bacillales bacterium]|nr:YicC/YloC family endoribonuclease [Bacillales bacterium]